MRAGSGPVNVFPHKNDRGKSRKIPNGRDKDLDLDPDILSVGSKFHAAMKGARHFSRKTKAGPTRDSSTVNSGAVGIPGIGDNGNRQNVKLRAELR